MVRGVQTADAPPGLRRETPLLWTPWLAVSAAALLVELPFLFHGSPSGHDVDFHLYSWLDVLAQWKQGIFYPRWAAMAHFGSGEPRFIFYPPLSWTLGATIAAILPWKFAEAVYIWMALVAAGSCMFLLARRWFDRRDAIFAAALYTANPYHLVIVYWRSAFAELLASCLVPLLLLAVLKVGERGWRAVAPLSLVLAAAWLTNAPAAVMIHYSLALLLLFQAVEVRSLRPLFVGAAAVALGACLAAVYLWPAIYEQKWIEIARAVSAGARPQDNYLLIHTRDAAHDAFNRLISWVALFEIAAVLTAAWAARAWRQSSPALWRALAGWAVACCLVMFSESAVLWKFLPKMQFMQFPWRWLLCLSMVFTLFVTAGLRRWWMRVAVCAVAVLVIVGAWNRIRPPWWDRADDLREMQDNMDDRIGYQGTDEYTPAGVDTSTVDQEGAAAADKSENRIAPPDVSSSVPGAKVHVDRWNAESKILAAESPEAGQLKLRLFPYPAWRVEVNGRVVDTDSDDDTDQMLVPIDAGMNRVQVDFTRTWDRTAGGWISGVSSFLLLAWFVKERRKSPHEESSEQSRVS
jgi:hypothetical protein